MTELYCPLCEHRRARDFIGTICDPDLRGRFELVLSANRPFAVVPADPRLQ